MVGFIIYFLVSMASFQQLSGQDEENACNSSKQLPRAAYRGGYCNYDPEKPVCDRLLEQGWYRARTSTQNLQIQNTPATVGKCGTRFPYWMNGSHPSVADGVVERQVCASSGINDCSLPQTIKVRNCTDYYIYKLKELQTCDYGYCFGKNNSCPPFDPCDIYEYTNVTLGMVDETGGCGNSSECYPTNSSFWVTFTGVDIFHQLNQTSLITSSACEYNSVVWTNEAAFDNGTVSRQLCFRNASETCDQTLTIKSKQCDGFTVYNLPDNIETTCNRYCFDKASHKWSICWNPHKDHPNSLAALNQTMNVFWNVLLNLLISIVLQNIFFNHE